MSGSTDELQRVDTAHYLHPFTDFRSLGEKGSRVITRAEGVYIYDSDGNQILDGMSGLWCVNIGYGRRELIDAATRQLSQLPYYNSFFQCTHPPAIRLSELLSEVTPPAFNHVFFTGSGSEANDTVIRMVRRYWDLAGQPERTTIISRHNAYHGSTLGAASLGGMKPMHQQAGLPIPGIVHIGQPYWFELGGQLSPEEFGTAIAGELEAKIAEIGPERVGAFIAEPVQGAGGVIIPPATYWPAIQSICDSHGILLIADEVITGFGRTGEWFGSEYFDIRPDLMPFAKGVTSGYLPLGGVMVGDRVADVLTDRGGEFAHGFTYSGHPVACAVAIANIEILRDEGIVDRARSELAPYFAERWAVLGEHPLVGEARSMGVLGALELVSNKDTHERFDKSLSAGDRCRDFSMDEGLVMRAVGDTMIAAPPLVVSLAQVDELADKAGRSLDRTLAALEGARS